MVEGVIDDKVITVPFIGRPVPAGSIKQFLKFCLIGLSSAIIDFSIMNLLLRHGMSWPVASSISFVVAVTNGFIWNSLWTFKGIGNSKRHEQYVKFVAVNIVGYILNICIMSVIIYAKTGEIQSFGPPVHNTHITHLTINVSKAIAVVFVSAWNFWASKRWTFK